MTIVSTLPRPWWRAWMAPGILLGIVTISLSLAGAVLGSLWSTADRLARIETAADADRRILYRLEDKVDQLLDRQVAVQ